ncbi:hypothetical protein FGL79_09065 [Latilactobacillus curvatus]|uniref:hypothetical protein n=1 Tax=Latilactobacillus curvatus TaxID=28038 RepID=UPI0011BBFA0C|nr:hypothetical protein [Latilactobacillus curvatus]QEA49943.1 hypothetical protein FGL79_09065 [Latilactobacillus curvatus]
MQSLISEEASRMIAAEVITLAHQMADEFIAASKMRPMNRKNTAFYANVDETYFDQLIIRGGLKPVYITATQKKYLPKDVDAALERMKQK